MFGIVLPKRQGSLAMFWMLCIVAAIAAASVTSILTGDPKRALVAFALCASPLLVYLTARWPLVFPFGAYVAMVPLDNLLSVAGGVTITKLLGIVSCGALVIRILVIRKAMRPGPAWYAWAVAVGWMTTTTLWSINQDETLKFLNIIATLFFVYTTCVLYPAERREVVVMSAITVLSGVSLAIFAFQQYLQGAQFSDSRLALGNDQYAIDPNHLAASFMLPIAVAVMGFLAVPNLGVRIITAISIAMMGLGILITGSRGGLISFGLLMLYIAIRTRRIKETLFVAGAGLIAALAFPKGFERFNDPSQGAASGRFYIWEIAGPALADRMHWIYGYGIGAFPTIYDREFKNVYQAVFTGYGRPGHNLIVQSAVELGVIGLALVLFAWFWTWRSAERIPVGTPWFALRVASEGVTVALFATAMSVDLLFFKYLWLAFALGPLAANAYAPRTLFGRRSAPFPLPSPWPVSATARSSATSSSSVASFEQTIVAPEM